MSSTEATNKAPAVPEKNNKLTRDEPVLQVERRDFIDLVPEKRPRAQSLRGFDECYT
ncbi:MAG TPA: ester cyclase, partial [Enterobacter sp.]|nr:ester cyclase [Enterobacter sp.]